MEYRRLGHTDIDVSAICLGTMTWGQQNTEAEGHEQMDYAVEMGINFFDTAEMYAVPPKAETQGKTVEIFGTWFQKNNNRQDIILATKVAGRAPMDWLRDDGSGTEQTPAQIHEAVDKSLKRLQTDYIDLISCIGPTAQSVFSAAWDIRKWAAKSIKLKIFWGRWPIFKKPAKCAISACPMRHPGAL